MYHQLLLKYELYSAMVSSNNTKQPDIILLIIQLDWTLTNCVIMINKQNILYQHNLIQYNTFNK